MWSLSWEVAATKFIERHHRRERTKLKQIHEVSLCEPVAFKSTIMHVDLWVRSRATVAYFKKRRLSHDPKFTLDYGLITGKHDREFSRPKTMSRRCFSVPTEDFCGCNYVLPDVLAFPPPPAAPITNDMTAVVRRASDDPWQHSLLFTVDTKSDVRDVITVIMKIHGVRDGERFVLLTFCWPVECLKLIA